MDSSKYSHNIKKDNIVGKLEVYDDFLTITTSQTNRKIDYDSIKSFFLSKINKKNFIIELKNNEDIHLVILDSEKTFNDTYIFLKNSIISIDEENYKTNEIPEISKQNNNNNDEKKINHPVNVSDNVLDQKINNESNDLPIIINADSTINKNLLYSLDKETFIKQDLSSIGNLNISSEGEFGLYNEYISINNPYYELNLPYIMLNKVVMKSTLRTVLTITLKNGSNFFINPINTDENLLEKIYHLLQEYIINPPKTSDILPNRNSNNYYQQQYPQQQYPQQQFYQQNFQQPFYNQVPLNKKSMLVAVVLHLFLVGLGYAYLNKWGKFLIVLIIEILCFLTSFLVIPAIIGLLLWLYVLIDTITMVNKYNNGEQY